MSFFWWYISLFRHFFTMIICNCFWFFLKPSEFYLIILLAIKSPGASAVFYSSLSYYFNLSLSINSCLSYGDAYLSLGISLSCSFVTVSEFFETFVILLAILLSIKSPVASTVFGMTLFEEVLSASVAYCLAWLRRFSLYLSLKFLLIYFYQYF